MDQRELGTAHDVRNTFTMKDRALRRASSKCDEPERRRRKREKHGRKSFILQKTSSGSRGQTVEVRIASSSHGPSSHNPIALAVWAHTCSLEHERLPGALIWLAWDQRLGPACRASANFAIRDSGQTDRAACCGIRGKCAKQTKLVSRNR